MEHQRLVELAEAHLWGHFTAINNNVDGMRILRGAMDAIYGIPKVTATSMD